MSHSLPPAVRAQLLRIDELSRTKRQHLVLDLRRLGLSYAEIEALVSIPKSTLATWCRDVDITAAQRAAIMDRSRQRQSPGRDTQWRRRAEVEALQQSALANAEGLFVRPLWLAGTTLYWAEGDKASGRQLAMTNTDENILRIFIDWVREFHSADAEFVLKLSLHASNDEHAARCHWAERLRLPDVRFHKTYVKPAGTGHRKNRIPHGVCTVRVCRSADAYLRTMAWIDYVSARLSD